MIEGVFTKKLKAFKDERGKLMEMLRCDDKIFSKFGQVYLTAVKPGYVKAWHYHKKQTDNFVCVKGKVRVGLYDGREGSKTKGEAQEFMLNLDDPILLQIPPNVLHGFEGVCDEECIVINIPTEPYNYKTPDEHRVDPFKNDIPFKWNSKKGN
jgi:dTDP-4-dehydrorhamnose 3,5-epimerase